MSPFVVFLSPSGKHTFFNITPSTLNTFTFHPIPASALPQNWLLAVSKIFFLDAHPLLNCFLSDDVLTWFHLTLEEHVIRT